MLKDHPETYRGYMEKTDMFLPKKIERRLPPSSASGKAVLFMVLSAITIESAFFLRDYTVNHLPIWTDANVSAACCVGVLLRQKLRS